MKIEVLGPGCPKCNKVFEAANKAVAEAGVEAEVIKVRDIEEIARYGVVFTPGLVIDGELRSVGRELTVEDIKRLITR